MSAARARIMRASARWHVKASGQWLTLGQAPEAFACSAVARGRSAGVRESCAILVSDVPFRTFVHRCIAQRIDSVVVALPCRTRPVVLPSIEENTAPSKPGIKHLVGLLARRAGSIARAALRIRRWEAQDETSAMARLGIDIDESTGLPNRTVNLGQPQSGALA